MHSLCVSSSRPVWLNLHECVCLWKWATDGRLSGLSLPVDGLSVAVPGLDRRVRRRGERMPREAWVAEGRTSKQQRAAGAIIPPNAPCLPHVCSGSLVSGRLSALMQKVTWVIECSSQRWGQHRPPVLYGCCGPSFAQSSGAILSLIQQSLACRVAVVIHYVRRPVLSAQWRLTGRDALRQDTAGQKWGCAGSAQNYWSFILKLSVSALLSIYILLSHKYC